MAAQEQSEDVILETIEECFERGWTDGLPVVPPTPAGLERMLRGTRRDPKEVIAILPPKSGVLTVENIALNALMAGCKPEYMPVVLAAAEAIADPVFNITATAISTWGRAPLMVVNGAIRHKLGINSRSNVFGPGWRANATIGRTVRLLMRNVGGALPGELDRATLGHPGKYAYCIGEDEEHSPWEPLHVQRGFASEASVVTVFNCGGPHQFGLPRGGAETILNYLTDFLRSVTLFGRGGAADLTIVFDEEQRRILGDAGYSKPDVQKFIFENTWRTAGEIRAAGSHFLPDDSELPDDEKCRLYQSEDAIYIIAAGAGNRFGAFMPTSRSEPGVRGPVSRQIEI